MVPTISIALSNSTPNYSSWWGEGRGVKVRGDPKLLLKHGWPCFVAHELISWFLLIGPEEDIWLKENQFVDWWHHGLDGRESEWTPGAGDGQRGLGCCDSWGRKESDTAERLNWTELICSRLWSNLAQEHFLFIYSFNFFGRVERSLLCRLFSGSGVWASYCGGFCHCGARAVAHNGLVAVPRPQSTSSIIVAPRLRCFAAHRIFPVQWLILCLLAGGLFTTELPGKPKSTS